MAIRQIRYEGDDILRKKCKRVEEVNDHDTSLVTGRLSNNLLVHFPGSADLIGKIVNVYLAECKGFYYMGEMR